MAIKNNYIYTGIEILFTLIVIFLLLPLMKNGSMSYYLIILIFLSQRIKNLFFIESHVSKVLFKFWNLVNGIVCIAAFAFSLSVMIPDVRNIFKNGILSVNYMLMGCIVLCLINDTIKFVYLTIDRNRISYNSKKKK